MANENSTILTPINYNHLAEALKYILLDYDREARDKYSSDNTNAPSSYSSLRNIDWNVPSQVNRLKSAFSSAYSRINFPFRSQTNSSGEGKDYTYDIDNANRITISELKPGQIILLGDSNQPHFYLITSYTTGDFSTFPSISQEDKFLFDGIKNRIGTVQALELRYDLIPEDSKEEIQSIANEIFEDLPSPVSDDQIFKYTDYSAYGNNFLQIGDVVFLVDPTQISFSTMNGYQYFPTLRTQGNPKVPTLQQIKNISISLIFPNADSINYQLLNLFAMFRRTPFVNIRNIDIVDFFKEIAIDEMYISVALESINIQSIEGFPNSLQVQITLLPFDPRVTSGGLKALKSMSDVTHQQAYIYRDRYLQHLIEKSDRMLNENSIISSKFYDIIDPHFSSSSNFKESVPFRSFYQALIKERNYVTDEFGNIDRTDQNKHIDLVPFRPTKEENYLHYYEEEANQIPIALKYRYIDGDFTDITKLINKERSEQELQKAQELRHLVNTMNTPQELLSNILMSFYDTTDFYEKYTYEYHYQDTIIQSFLARHGIGIEGPPADEIKTIFQYLGKTMNPFNKGGSLLNAIGQGWDFVTGNVSTNDAPDVVGQINSLIWNESLDDKVNTGAGVSIIKDAVDGLYDWMSDNDERKKRFIAFLEELGNRMRSQLNDSFTVMFDAASDDFMVTRLPIKDETVVIDNKTDVITGWNIQFSNKFVPINISAFKYPFYQHMGSDDVSISLNIVSCSDSKLKGHLSYISDRLYEGAKIIQLNAPEMHNYMDARITITDKNGNLLPNGNLFRVFGISKVVYNSSNTTNINKSPGSWNTVLGLTQANFTISDYHAVESIETEASLKEELSKLLMRMEIDNNGIITIYDYKTIDVDHFPENIKSIVNSSESTDVKIVSEHINTNKTSLVYTDIQDIETLIRFSYLFSAQAEELTSHIGQVKSQVAQDLKKTAERELPKLKAKKQKVESNIAAAENHISRGNNVLASMRILEFEKKNLIEIQRQIDSYTNSISMSKQMHGSEASIDHQRRVAQKLNGVVIRVPNKETTVRMNNLISDYPVFGKIIRYNLNIIQELYRTQTDGMKTLIGENEGYWKAYLKSIASDIQSNVDRVKDADLGGLILLVTTGTLIISSITSFIGAGREWLLDKLKSHFAEFFATLIQKMRQSTIGDLAGRIIKDPIIYNKFLAGGFLPASAIDYLRHSMYKTITNCYNDFDFRPFIKTGAETQTINPSNYIKLTPDFYLYNFRLSDSEIIEHVDEALDRYINIGKLTSLTGIIETAEAYKRFNNIEDVLGKQLDSDTIHNKVKNIIYHKGNYEESINEVLEWYKQSVFLDVQWKDKNAESAFKNPLSEDKIQELLDEFDELNPFPGGIGGVPSIPSLGINREFSEGTPAQRAWKEKRRQYESILRSKTNRVEIDRDKFIINIIYAARARALIELYETYRAINNYLINRTSATNRIIPDKEPRNKDKTEQSKHQKLVESIDQLTEYYKDITTLLENADKDYLKAGESDDFMKNRIQPNVSRGGNINATSNSTLPDILLFKNHLYDKIASYIRLNNAVKLINDNRTSSNFRVRDVLNTVPELQFLQYWNYREREALVRRLETLDDFISSYSNRLDTNLRMFPAFKLYFIEEDKGIFNQLDDYYVYNAIQSIEITSNKNRASKVARIRLSNAIGSLTDRLSLHRESSDFPFASDPVKKDNVFFGTLDVKPGTSMMIKMGYAANDKDLPVAFVGRIIEMNSGPEVEIIAQSYSAQLNQEILHEKFGMFGTVKAHGDVASALLDLVPGLEKMGKSDAYSIAKGFSGKNIRKYKGTFADRFLLSNILGSVSALAFSQDNPRDDNIYLPYDLADTVLHKPNFDWVVYNQSVWNSLQELCLYNRNTRPMIRLYNNDPLSSKGDVRETLVLGDKGGYYKFTDSFSLSSKDYEFIDKKVDELIAILTKITEKDFSNSSGPEVFRAAKNTLTYKRKSKTTESYLESEYEKIFDDSFYRDVYTFFSHQTGALIAALHILRNTKFDKSNNIFQDLSLMLGTKIEGFGTKNTLIANIMKMSNLCEESDLADPRSMSQEKMRLFSDVLSGLHKLRTKEPKLPVDMIKEDFYIINPLLKNTDESLVYKPNYKKIQRHHLISDDTDIISNNVIVSTNFHNAVNLYYPDKPIVANVDGLTDKQIKNLNVWRIKAFGDTRDEFIRPLNSFQKNIDVSWYEVNNSIEGFFQGFKKIQDRTSNGKIVKDYRNQGNQTENFNPNSINLDALPAFWTVGLSLLQREIEKMYQGTIEIIGNPMIQPFDILHINDNLNDMHGAVEVEEVTHIFTPDIGFKTIITPNLITYDRSPIQMQDISVINNIYDFAKTSRNVGMATIGGVGAVFTGAGIISALGQNWFGAAMAAGIGIPMLWNGTVGLWNKYKKFLYDQFGQIMGRDCINFTSLIYHNKPYIGGFDGIDYTSLKTLINYKVQDISDSTPIARLAAFNDPFAAVVSTNWDPKSFGLIGAFQNHISAASLPGIPIVSTGIPAGSTDYNLNFLDTNFF